MGHCMISRPYGRYLQRGLLWLSCLSVACFGSPSFAQIVVVDDFSDPSLSDWTKFDVTSLTGEPWGPSDIAVNGKGELVVASRLPIPIGATGGSFAGATWDAGVGNPQFLDGSFQARLRLNEPGMIARLLMRTTGSLETGFDTYAFLIETGRADNALGIAKIIDSITVVEESIDNVEVPLDTDLYLEATAVLGEISMKVWPVDQPKPEFPQVTLSDMEYLTEGTLGIAAQRDGLTGEQFFESPFYVAFDDLTFTGHNVEAVTIPEPSSALLALFIFALLMSRRRRGPRLVRRRLAALALASVTLSLVAAPKLHAQLSFDLGTILVDYADGPGGGAIAVSITGGPYNHVQLTTDWTQEMNSWSNEAIWSIAKGSLPNVFPNLDTTLLADPGKAPNSEFDGDPVTLEWSTMMDLPIAGAMDAYFLPHQGCCDEPGRTFTANWSNTVLEFSNVTPPAAPALDANLGTVAAPYNPFGMHTTGDFDTEIGVYPAATGALIAHNDDDLSDPLNPTDLSAFSFANGLPAGDYMVAIGGFNTTYGDAYTIAAGSEGGNYGISVGGNECLGTLAPDSVAYVGFSIADPSLPGDYNDDGTVNLVDYTVWRNSLGAPAGTLPNEPIGGAIGVAQYENWKTNFGVILASAASPQGSRVPELSSLCLLALGLIAASGGRRLTIVINH